MAAHSRIEAVCVLMVVGLGCAACGGGISTASLGIPAATELPALPKLPSLPEVHGQSSLPPTEVYALVARGATSCWFGAGGALRQTHVFYADADPPSSGGKAEIAILERVQGGETVRGPRAYRIALSPSAGGTVIEQSNQKLPEALATAVEADVGRFARGALACAGSGPTAPQVMAVAAPAAAAAKPKAKPRQKSAATTK